VPLLSCKVCWGGTVGRMRSCEAGAGAARVDRAEAVHVAGPSCALGGSSPIRIRPKKCVITTKLVQQLQHAHVTCLPGSNSRHSPKCGRRGTTLPLLDCFIAVVAAVAAVWLLIGATVVDDALAQQLRHLVRRM
jgi:hypothetical protein